MLMGCAGAAKHAPEVPTQSSDAPSARQRPLTLEQLVISQNSAETLQSLHARGLLQLEQHNFNLAERDFALCVQASPNGPLTASCLYHGAIACDEQRKFEPALQLLTELTSRFPEHELAPEASLRALRLAVHLESWELAARISERILARRQKLRPFELVLPHGALAMDAVTRGDDVTADQLVSRARTIIEEQGLDVPGTIHRDLAVVYFALGEVRRLRAERLVFIPLPVNFAETLEQRCQLILDAQSAYSDAMRAHDAHWSTMAGYRVGELYASLHGELMRTIEAHHLEGAERKQLFEGAMRLRYSVLVQKALNMLEHTLDMADRVGEKSDWVDRARATKGKLVTQKQAEEDAINRLPYSREALTFALSRLLDAKGKTKSEPNKAVPLNGNVSHPQK
jgi:tetratricopeptide (TPR) repeat protein